MGMFVYAGSGLPGSTAPNPGHSSDQIYIQYGSNYVTLQHAVDRRYLANTESAVASEIGTTTGNAPDNTFPTTTPWHYASQILIQVPASSGSAIYTMTLQEAIDNNVFKDGATKSYTTTLPLNGQKGNTVNIILSGVTQSLQGALSSKEMLCNPVSTSTACGSKICGSVSDGCGGSLSCGSCQTNFNCDSAQTGCIYKNAGATCTPSGTTSSCISSSFKYQNDGSCSGGSYQPTSHCCSSYTKCSSGSCSTTCTEYCDGSGHCSVAPSTSSSSSSSSSHHSSSSTTTSTSTSSSSSSAATTPGSYDSSCFTANQKVLTPSGEVPISQIKPGDTVVSYDPTSKELKTSVVKYLVIHDGKDYLSNGMDHLYMNNYSKYPLLSLVVEEKSGKTITQVTSSHPYYDPVTGSYKEIGNFNIGEEVQDYNGIGIILGKNEIINGSSDLQQKSTVVYTLGLEGPYHNFFVNGILVHNYS